MYLHLGENVIARNSDILGVFDIDNTTVAKDTRTFLNKAETRGEIIAIGSDIPKSFIVLAGKKRAVYLSQMSTSTLKKRNVKVSKIGNF